MSYLGKSITRTSSFQTYITILLFVDRELRAVAYDAYAYFRWLDDYIDTGDYSKPAKLNFLKRQWYIINEAYSIKKIPNLSPQEYLIFNVIRSNHSQNSKLYTFIKLFYEIIYFDAQRKGKVISSKELEVYTQKLSKAVMSGLEYFIHSDYRYPSSPHKYSAPQAAHILHMLRDYKVDLKERYINIPKEFYGLTDSPIVKAWVKSRVQMAQALLTHGKKYILSLPYMRCQIAGLWYCARFEGIIARLKKYDFNLSETGVYRHTSNLYIAMLGVAFVTICSHISSLIKKRFS